MESWQLKQRQSLPLKAKIILSKQRIKDWHDYWHGLVYVSFSGGKDSTVLLDLVRDLYPNTPAVFIDTGLEYPEIRDFVKTIENVIWVKPKMSFNKVIERYGYPVLSKKISMGLDRYRNTKSEEQKRLRLYGGTNPTTGKKQQPTIPKKYHYLVDAPFKTSERCCDILKKNPVKDYEKKTGQKSYVGTMAHESNIRLQRYMKEGCNSFITGKSQPLSFWLEEDIWQYIKEKNIAYSKIYDMGESRTGCMFCMFGVHYDGVPNRFQRMQKSHPKQYDYCINKLGCGKVLDYIHIPYDDSGANMNLFNEVRE